MLLVGYPVPEDLAARSPRLAWAHHTQAGVSNLAGTDLWDSEVTLTSSRGAMAATAIAEYALAAAAHFARGLHEAARQKAAGQFTRDGYQTRTLGGATMGVIGLGGIGREVARLSRAAGMRVIGTRRSVTAPLPGADGADLVLPAGRILRGGRRERLPGRVLSADRRDPRVYQRPGLRGDETRRGADQRRPGRGGRRGRPRRGGHHRADPRRGPGRLRRRARRLPPRPELTALPQILLTPHISASGDTNMAGPLRRLFAENLRRYLDGQPLLNVVDRARGY